MNPAANNANASVKLAWMRAIAYFAADGLRNLLLNEYRQCFNVTETPQQILSSIPQHYYPANQPWMQAPMHQPPHLMPSNEKKQRRCVEADINEIHRRAEAGILNIRCEYLDGSELFVNVPPFSVNDHCYNNELLRIANRYAPQSPLTTALIDNYVKKFDQRCTATFCIRRGFNAYHASNASFDLENGKPVPIPIIPKSVALDPRKNINWDKVYAGNLPPAELASRAVLWDTSNGQRLDRPPPHHLRNNQSYTHANPNKEPLPSKAELQQLLTHAGYDTQITKHCNEALGMNDGGDAYMEDYRGVPCLTPSTMQSPATICSNPRHFNKRASAVGEGSNVYQDIRSQYDDDSNDDDLDNRAAGFLDFANDKILTRLRSNDFVERESPDSADNWYAMDSFVGALGFHLLHEDGGGRQLHYPDGHEEFSRGAMMQVLANRDLLRAGAMGLDFTNHDSLKHMARGRLPIPVVASYHVEWGDPEHPILGATFTVMDECYRPTMGRGIVKFSYA